MWRDIKETSWFLRYGMANKFAGLRIGIVSTHVTLKVVQ